MKRDDLLEQVHKVIKQLHLDVDVDGIFAPGVRRGYAMISLQRRGETDDQQRVRAIKTVQSFNDATLSVEGKPGEGRRKLWLTTSQPLQRRKRAKLAGKVKRLTGGHQAEPGSGVVTSHQGRCGWMASASAPAQA